MNLKSLDEIRRNVITCTKCDLCKDRMNAVPGKGSKNSKIIFIGEAPGRSEDKIGEPFVGTAGKKLSIALEYAGISRNSVYITNVVKCRPPKNRIPKQEERDSCSQHLKSEIELIKPKIICIMGNTAFNSLLGGNNITKNHGKIVTKEGKQYFLTIHPAAVIYNQDLLEILKNDMKKLAKIISKN